MTKHVHEPVLVGLNVLALLAGAGWATWQLLPAAPDQVPTAAATVTLELPTLAPISTDQIEARPLFHLSRQPIAIVPVKTDSAEAANAQAVPKLVGIVGPDGAYRALLQGSDGKRAHLAQKGEAFGGWKVTWVRARSVSLQSGSQSVELALPRAATGSVKASHSSSSFNGRSPPP